VVFAMIAGRCLKWRDSDQAVVPGCSFAIARSEARRAPFRLRRDPHAGTRYTLEAWASGKRLASGFSRSYSGGKRSES
jgi:hypothetical protein